ncbi:DDE-type integrase/transposase/recombinase [Leisingera sp. SS27]|uniref:Mu transposase C-terminal domain-containing protein n=1 Tax=Leisingera sp. SS27 TaxID=2979462 RepID=UPI00232D7D59|nr:Mu transposase C-terminal domain-containing protein [Leisingera sp. SS27]MDC0657806.1 DDE-type integrase/transposase/recombinase [Leisingera sp. SS27]
MPVKLRLSKSDALIASGRVQIIDRVSDSTVDIRSMDGSQHPMSLSHADLKSMLDSGHATIEYGYFSCAQAARRALAGRSIISRMRPDEKALIFWKQMWVEGFLEAEGNFEVTRSEKGVAKFLPELTRRMEAKLLEAIRIGQNGPELAMLLKRKPPCRTSLMNWVRDWQKTRDPMCFVKRSRFNGSNAKGISRQVEGLVQNAIKTFLHPNRVNVSRVTEEANRAVRQLYKTRALGDHMPEREVSERTVRRRIEELNRFETCAARHGLAVAKNKYGPYGQGLEVEAPLQRIEMDEWQIDLLAILDASGVDASDPKFDELKTGRFWVCVAIDAATRVILAVKLAKTPSVETALATLWLAMRSKSQISADLGCQREWVQHGHIFNVVVDNGPSFVNPEFKAALSDLGIGYEVLPAGVPKLRARVERVFRSLGTMLMPFLTGRTFGNPQERGDYPADKYVVHTAESIVELLVRFVVDAYHHRSHQGLAYATPADTWDRLERKFGHSPAKSPHVLRHILGVPLQRQLGRHGVLVCGIAYNSVELARYFQRCGGAQVDVRLDPEDLGHLSVWFDDAWHTLKAGIAQAVGISLSVWEAAAQDFRRRNRSDARLHVDVVDAALERIKQLDDNQRAWRQIGPLTVSARDIRRAENECFLGLNLAFETGTIAEVGRSDVTRIADALNTRADVKFPSDAGQKSSTAPREGSETSDPQSFVWRFSDEDEQDKP